MFIRCLPIARLVAVCAIAFSAPGFGATFTVDQALDLVDNSPGDGFCAASVPLGAPRCTLRAAVMEAEANGEADSIFITPGLLINLSQDGEGGAEIGDLEITTEIDILGFSGPNPPINPALLPQINAAGLDDRHFEIISGQLTLRGLVLRNGSPTTAGGAVLVRGNSTSRLTAEYVIFRNNFSSTRGGAISVGSSNSLEVSDSHFFLNNAGEGGASGAGGAIYILGSEIGAGNNTIRRSSFVDNRSNTFGSTITVEGSGMLQVENSTFDGSPFVTPIPGIEALTGITLLAESTLIVRNSTITNFASRAIELRDLDGDEFVRIGHSILQGDNAGCRGIGPDLDAANVRIAYSIVESEVNCSGFFQTVVLPGPAELDSLNLDDAPRLTLSRRPSSPLSNVVDRGLPPGAAAADPAFRCTDEDQLGNPRPQDADLDERFSCDFGAIEQSPPEPFIVNHFADDLTDDLPGDGLCATVDVGAGPVCTLRAAIMEANALPGLQHVMFEPSAAPALLTLPDSGGVGGALQISETLAIDGNLESGRPATTIEGQMPGERLFLVDTGDVPVYFRNLRLTGGDAGAGVGGALAALVNSDVRILRSEIHNNFAVSGGGAVAVLGGSLELHDSDFQGNQSDSGALGLFANFDSQIEIFNSSFRDHLGVDAGGAPQPAIGLDPGVSMRSFNTTFSGNQLALVADNPDLLVMQHSTMADQINGGLIAELNASSQVAIGKNIVSAPGSMQFDCVITGADIAQFFQIDYVLDSDGSCAQFAGQIGLTSDPLLMPIQRPAGRISYHHPPSVAAENPSPVLDVATIDTCTINFDQYDNPRPIDFEEIPNADGPCDLGSVESAVFDLLFMDSFE